jgi:hypothetical protein
MAAILSGSGDTPPPATLWPRNSTSCLPNTCFSRFITSPFYWSLLQVAAVLVGAAAGYQQIVEIYKAEGQFEEDVIH